MEHLNSMINFIRKKCDLYLLMLKTKVEGGGYFSHNFFRLSQFILLTLYFVVSETLMNVTSHSLEHMHIFQYFVNYLQYYHVKSILHKPLINGKQ